MCLSSTFASEPRDEGLISVGDQLPPAFLPRVAALLATGLFFLVILGTLLTDVLAPLPPPRPYGVEAEKEAQLRASAHFSDGSLAKLFERDLRKRSRVRRWVMDKWARFLYCKLRWTKPPVICGPGGWLFLEERILAGGKDPEREIRWAGAVLAAVERRVAALGYELLLVPVPRKARMAAAELPGGYDARPRLDDELLEEFGRRHLDFVDLRPEFEEVGPRVYNMVGSHWSDEGQLVAARAVARRLGVSPDVSGKMIQVVDSASMRVDRDFLTMAGVSGFFRLPAEAARKSMKPVQVPEGNGSGGRAGKPGRIVLLGTSFSVQARPFGSYLEALLDEGIWNGAMGGAMPGRVLVDFERLGASSQVVILESPMDEFLGSAHMHFGNETFTRRAPKGILRLRPASETELRAPLGREFMIEGERLIMDLPTGRFATSGDGALSIRLKGQVSANMRVALQADGLGTVRYRWRPEEREIVIPVLDLVPASRRIRLKIGPEEPRPAELLLKSVEWVSEVSPRPMSVLSGEEIEATQGGWRAVIRLDDERVLSREAILKLRLAVKGGDFKGKLDLSIFPEDGSEALKLGYEHLGRGAVVVSSLRVLAGRAVERIELGGLGPAPDRILNQSTLHFGKRYSVIPIS